MATWLRGGRRDRTARLHHTPTIKRPRTVVDERVYASFYPYFAEYCAVSEFNKKKGLGVELEGGGPGGHSVFYLNGACRVRDAGYPELALCDEFSRRHGGTGCRPQRQ